MLIQLLRCDVCSSLVAPGDGFALQHDDQCSRVFDTGKEHTTCSGTLKLIGIAQIHDANCKGAQDALTAQVRDGMRRSRVRRD